MSNSNNQNGVQGNDTTFVPPYHPQDPVLGQWYATIRQTVLQYRLTATEKRVPIQEQSEMLKSILEAAFPPVVEPTVKKSE